MSRIHEALKKAEEERATGLRQEDAARAAERPEPVAVQRGNPPVRVAADIVTTDPVELEEIQITIEALQANCPKFQWKPDSKKVLFLTSQSHALGTEEFRTLRSRLYEVRDWQPLRKLLITSALPQEG